MPRIKFTQDYTVKSGDGIFYKAGTELECNRASADHFKRKDVAVDVKASFGPATESSVKDGDEKKSGAVSRRGRPPKEAIATESETLASQPSPSITVTNSPPG